MTSWEYTCKWPALTPFDSDGRGLVQAAGAHELSLEEPLHTEQFVHATS